MVIGVFGESCTGKITLARRMGGNLPAPVAAMLERKHGCFDGEAHHIHVRTGVRDPEEACKAIVDLCGRK